MKDPKPHSKSRVKKPWPTDAAMTQVYEMNLWGGEKGEFFSGEGSHDSNIITPYIEAVIKFLRSFENPPSVADLGCGDFNVGKELAPYSRKYIAVDIVEPLIARNEEEFEEDHLEFCCLDIAKDVLPHCEVALVRQVLQHLSNAEIQMALQKLTDFKYVILTEHIPQGQYRPNEDIISGQGTRLKKGSGVDVTLPPFNFRYATSKKICEVQPQDGKGVIVTTLFEQALAE